ncbi:hypothetical protein DWUX_672 [Desulfovibrio diazotrophicus]|nr:hypothetical protein DWUX_672 [Desulfovibrio diazotrophicus]VVU43091.1 hypothetical protein DWUX_437 [Desulfovibrio diazotrophicus]
MIFGINISAFLTGRNRELLSERQPGAGIQIFYDTAAGQGGQNRIRLMLCCCRRCRTKKEISRGHAPEPPKASAATTNVRARALQRYRALALV